MYANCGSPGLFSVMTIPVAPAALARDAKRAVEIIENHFIGSASAAMEAILGADADGPQLIAKLRKDVHAGLGARAIVE